MVQEALETIQILELVCLEKSNQETINRNLIFVHSYMQDSSQAR